MEFGKNLEKTKETRSYKRRRSKSETKKAFEAVFKMIVFLEPRSLEYLKTFLEEHKNLRE